MTASGIVSHRHSSCYSTKQVTKTIYTQRLKTYILQWLYFLRDPRITAGRADLTTSNTTGSSQI